MRSFNVNMKFNTGMARSFFPEYSRLLGETLTQMEGNASASCSYWKSNVYIKGKIIVSEKRHGKYLLTNREERAIIKIDSMI